MLSDFEVPRPNLEFNQIFLDSSELYLQSIKVVLCLDLDWEVTGQLNFCTRCVIFQPKDERLPLFKFRYCDNMEFRSGKGSLETIFAQREVKLPSFVAAMNRVLPGVSKAKRREDKSLGVTMLIRVSKFSVYERSPPSTFSSELFPNIFVFKIDSKASLKNETVGSSGLMIDDAAGKFAHFDQLVKHIRSSSDEQMLNENLKRESFANYVAHGQKKQKNFQWIYPCEIIETFERFYGVIFMDEMRNLKIKAILNKTKEISIKLSLRDIKWMTLYPHSYQMNGIEIFTFSSSKSILLKFEKEKSAEKILRTLKDGACEMIQFQLESLTKHWARNLLSNFDYLISLNRLANRSFNDISRYPVFPWVISDYVSDELRINSKRHARDLSKPIGAVGSQRAAKAAEQYKSLAEDPLPIKKPCNFNTYVMTPGYVNFFYLRSVPSLIVKLQSGAFGPNDRIFRGFEQLWETIHSGHTQPVELIPEFYCPNRSDLLLNSHRLDLGQGPSLEEIDDVKPARWATNLQDFLLKMKAALESDVVSLSLAQWIDLTFGKNSRGADAITALNVYYETCYPENVNFSAIKSQLKEDSLRLQVQEFGQVPPQLFKEPHPKKKIKAQIQNIAPQPEPRSADEDEINPLDFEGLNRGSVSPNQGHSGSNSTHQFAPKEKLNEHRAKKPEEKAGTSAVQHSLSRGEYSDIKSPEFGDMMNSQELLTKLERMRAQLEINESDRGRLSEEHFDDSDPNF